MVTCAEQQIAARNPLLVIRSSELNLTVMLPVAVLVKGPGMEEPENCWVDDPTFISTLSKPDSVSKLSKVRVIACSLVDCKTQVYIYNNQFKIQGTY